MIHDLKTERARLLIRQLIREREMSQTDVSKLLGISTSVVSNLLSGARGIGAKSIGEIRDALGLRSDFFYEESLGDSPDYRDHLLGRAEAEQSGVEPPHWAEFLLHYPRVGQLSETDKARMRAFASHYHTITSWFDWAKLAEWVLEVRDRQS